MSAGKVCREFMFDWKGIAALFGGFVTGSLTLAFLNVSSIFIFKENLQYSELYFVLANVLPFLAAIAAFDLLVVRPETGRRFNLPLWKVSPILPLILFPMMFGLMLVAEFFTDLLPTDGPYFGPLYDYFSRLMAQLLQDPPTMLLLVVICAPVLEEIIFRGIIQKGLINKGVKPWRAIIIATVIFGAVHGNPWQFLGALLLGSLLGIVYYKTNSLLLPILMHGLNNLLSAVLLLKFKTESFTTALGTDSFVLLLVGLVLFAITFWLFVRLQKSTVNS